MGKLKGFIPYVIIFVVVVIIRTFIATPVVVSGSSMEDTLSGGDILLLNKYDTTYKYGDVVVFDYEGEKLVKRVIGEPGDTVRYIDNILYINGYEVSDSFASSTSDFDIKEIGVDFIPDDYYFVMGDNRENSIDSRFIGLVHKDQINGVSAISIWPPKKIASN